MNSKKYKSYAFGRYFEEFNVGDVFEHLPKKTITESDNNLFSLLTMNHHPIHLDIEYAKLSQHKQILVIGTLIFSLTVGLSVRDISGKAIANLSYDKIIHKHPVFINDTIKAKSTVLKKRKSKSKNDRGIIHIKTSAYNQKNKEVLTFERTILISKKNK